jgi:hypothetical protein
MGDQRVREFCDSIFGLAATYIDRIPMRQETVRLGNKSVSLHMPDIELECGIDPLKGMIPLDTGLATADFDIVCIDARSTVPLPIGEWPSTWHGPVGVMADYRSEPFRFAFDRHSQAISVFHPGWCRGVVWMWNMELMPYWAAATPWRLMLSWCADTFDAEFIHAGSVVNSEVATLLVGPSGAGKSTLALAAAEEGFGLVGDDYVLVHNGNVFPIYRRAKVHDATIALLNDSWVCINPQQPTEKRILDITPKIAQIPVAGVRVASAAAPILRGQSDIKSVSSGTILKRSAPYSLSGVFGGTRRSLLRMKALYEPLSCFTFPVGRERQEDLGCLVEIFECP